MRYVRSLLLLPVLSLLMVSFFSCNVETKKSEQLAPNILFIPVDDLRPELGAYGSEDIITPHIDRLAQQGVTFTRAYCQQAVCNPSRASLLTGLRPDSIRVWDLRTNFRQNLPDIVTLPQFFKEHGYTTIGLGKTFHNNIPDTLSWTEKPHIDGFPFDPDAVYANEENLEIQESKIRKMKDAGVSRIDQLGHWYVKANATENAELRGYSDCHELPLPYEEPWDEERQREIKHGYYASVSYIDAQIGRLVDEIERLGLAKNTIVVLWGDHGWKLGEHNGWCKQGNYEIDTRSPLIISGAGVKAKGEQSNALTEFVDIYPSLCEMAGFEIPGHLQGTSLVPLLENPDTAWKTAAFSQFLLGKYGRTKRIKNEMMGYSIRTDRYRYVEWYRWNKEEERRGEFLRSELFDHYADPQENNNLADDEEYKETVELLSRQLNM